MHKKATARSIVGLPRLKTKSMTLGLPLLDDKKLENVFFQKKHILITSSIFYHLAWINAALEKDSANYEKSKKRKKRT